MSNNKRVCQICQTDKFRKSTDSGLVCKYGHKVLGFQAEQAEDDGFSGARGMRRKTVANRRETDLESSPAQQRSEFLLIIQFTLQVLSRSLVQRLDFPPELESTVRELWLLYISDSKKQLAEAYLFEALESEDASKLQQNQVGKKDILEKFEEEIMIDNFRDDDDSSEDEQPERIGSSRNKWPTLIFSNTLSFIYLACIYLNFPVLPNDLVRWCRSGDIPYLKMQGRISPEKLSSLSLHYTNSMTQIPTPGRVKNSAYILSRCYLSNCKLKFPDFNIPLYLDRFCAQYFLTVEGYYYAECIFESYRTRNLLDLCVQNRRREKVPATTFLMASVVAAVKLIYAIGDNHPETLYSHSEFDETVTKEMYMERIRQNISQWKKIYGEQDDLNNIIQHIRDTSVASRIGARVHEKNVTILNAMDERINDHSTRMKAPTKTPFMDTSAWFQPENCMSIDSDVNKIKQGRLYYSKRAGFATPDYLDILELATLVTGEVTGSNMEIAIQKVDVDIIRNNPTNRIKMSIYNKLFKSAIPL